MTWMHDRIGIHAYQRKSTTPTYLLTNININEQPVNNHNSSLGSSAKTLTGGTSCCRRQRKSAFLTGKSKADINPRVLKLLVLPLLGNILVRENKCRFILIHIQGSGRYSHQEVYKRVS